MRNKIVKYKFEDSIRKDLQSLITNDNWHCFTALAEDFLVIAFAVFISMSISWFFLPISLLLIGSRQRALATILHESAHGVFAKNKKINYIMGTFFSGYLIIQTMSSYKSSHINNHHAHFGNPDRDPDFKYAVKNGLYKEDALSVRFWKNFINPLFLTKVPSYLKSLIKDRLTAFDNGDRKEFFVFLAYWSFIISLTVLTSTFHYFLIFWLIPYITVFNIIGWYIELSEHYPLMKNDNSLYMSRNRHSHFVEQFLTGMHNENYHLIHHLYPTIPFWNLPKAHAVLMRDENYARQDRESGGIFLSKDTRPSLMKKLRVMRRKKQDMLA